MSNLDKETVGRIIGIVLTAVIALLSVAGYHVVVVQPAVAAIESRLVVERAGPAICPCEIPAAGE